MGERRFRFDLILALSALVISTIAALASVFQTRVIARQLSATVWPYVSLEHTYSIDGAVLNATNYGQGPALIRSAWLESDGKSYNSWDELIASLRHAKSPRGAHGKLQLRASSIDGSTVLSAGATRRLVAATGTGAGIALSTRAIERLNVRLCYCSLLGECWIVATNTNAGPTPQSSCPNGPKISLSPPRI
jgi:hypothetical protein